MTLIDPLIAYRKFLDPLRQLLADAPETTLAEAIELQELALRQMIDMRLGRADPCRRCGVLCLAVGDGSRVTHIHPDGMLSSVGCRAASFDRAMVGGDEDASWDNRLNKAWKATLPY